MEAFFGAPEDLEESGHAIDFMGGVGAGEDVGVTVVVEIHNLWSGGGASPDAGDFGDFAVDLEPIALGDGAVAFSGEDLDFSFGELSDEEVFFAIAGDIGPAGGGVAGGLDFDGLVPGHHADGRFEFERGGVGEGERGGRKKPPEEVRVHQEINVTAAGACQ